MFRRLMCLAMLGGLAAAFGIFGAATAASASTPGGYSAGAVYQITWSLNCDNRSAACASDPNIGLGGFWGWVALLPADANGVQADNGQETVCGHPGGGALHQSFDSTWSSFPSSSPPGPVADPNGQYILINDTFGLFPVPATMGHYSVSFEGAKGQIQVSP